MSSSQISPIPAASTGAENSCTSPRRRAKGPRGKLPATAVVTYSTDGATVTVELHGTYGRGKLVTLDAEDWQRIEPVGGPVWVVNWNGQRTSYSVCRTHKAVAEAAGQQGDTPRASLARLVAGAKGPNEVVWYLDRDPLNCRASNLEIITHAERMARVRSLAGA